jgi:hypothetical protein
MFLIGKINISASLAAEQEKYNDIHFLDCPDDYEGLTAKVKSKERE